MAPSTRTSYIFTSWNDCRYYHQVTYNLYLIIELLSSSLFTVNNIFYLIEVGFWVACLND